MVSLATMASNSHTYTQSDSKFFRENKHEYELQCVELCRRPCLTSIPTLLMQRRLRWFSHAVRRRESELIKDLLLPTPPRTWRRRAGGQLKTRATTVKADLEPLSWLRISGHVRWRKDWVKLSSELAQDRRPWSSSFRDVVNLIGDASSARSGWMPTQVQVSKLKSRRKNRA